MFKKVLVANRGEIACRIIRTLDKMGIQSVAVYADADRNAPHVQLAGEAIHIGPSPVAESYLRIDRVIEAALSCGAEAIHPGYGLLSENADFARSCEQAGLRFIGPSPEHLVVFGLKHEARKLVEQSQGPLLPGTGLVDGVEQAISEAGQIGFPVMLKSTAGGGGIGMQICSGEAALRMAYDRVDRLSRSHFGQGGIFLEKYIANARHLEVQIFGDGSGKVVSLGVRDCSSQRRNQKVIEETPPANITDEIIEGLQLSALRLAGSVKYRSAGTVEYIYDNDSGEYFFLEVNTRLQVEHGVTELVTGVDLVEWMVKLAAGDQVLNGHPDCLPQDGHSIQARLYAENPYKDFQPSSGLLTRVAWPEGVRVDSWVEQGSEISPFYDPLLAKVLVYSESRGKAVHAMQAVLEGARLDGIETNLGYLKSIVSSPSFVAGSMLTRTLSDHAYQPRSFEILRAGTMTTVQDYPGRTGYWDVGVPPSGPMDSLGFRIGNRLIGNENGAAGLEITATGPRIEFHSACHAVLTGAEMVARLNDKLVPPYAPFDVRPGDVLDIGKVKGCGVRGYLCLTGGIAVPEYLGSRSTFTLGQFGGHGGRALRAGDILHLGHQAVQPPSLPLEDSHCPRISSEWELGVLYGPHGAPDFFTEKDIEVLFSTEWEVHYNSARTGVRLIGPKPEWARTDGGEAGLHPSNIHDNAYAVGAVDFTGDMPVILGPDGPSLGGFVCPVTVIEPELWKLGQLRPGDRIRFRCMTPEEAEGRRLEEEAYIESCGNKPFSPLPHHHPLQSEAILSDVGSGADRLVLRQSGDACILAEIGEMKLDFKLRFHIHVLHEALKKDPVNGLINLTPGIRSLQLHYNTSAISRDRIVEWVCRTNRSLPPLENVTVPSRVVHLPLSWDDPSTREAIRKYMQSVRPDAPWCPDNIEFIRRINGLDSREAVHEIVFGASYVVLGLGDVYLGAPVATPLDPRHRLVTTKYNPARTWTPENAVGIGGAYMCIYGMEGPGGYQFVGRTLQMWNRHKSTDVFKPGKPWLLRFFDQIRFYPVSTGELAAMREDFPHGRFSPRIEETEFSLGKYLAFLEENAASIDAFKQHQQSAFNEERSRWEAAGIAEFVDADEPPSDAMESEVPDGSEAIESPVAGSLWKLVHTTEGVKVGKGEILAIVESMKMEINIEAPCAGTLTRIHSREAQPVSPGKVLFTIEPE